MQHRHPTRTNSMVLYLTLPAWVTSTPTAEARMRMGKDVESVGLPHLNGIGG